VQEVGSFSSIEKISEHRRMIDAVGIADERIGEAAGAGDTSRRCYGRCGQQAQNQPKDVD
jgi:hypothetical protein